MARESFPFKLPLAEDYNRSDKIGEGTYGTVWRTRCPERDVTIAIKKVELIGKEKDFPVTAIREVRNLRQLNHGNVVKLFDVIAGAEDGKPSVYLFFEYAPSDLTGLLAYRKQKMKPEEVKCLTSQMFEAVDYCHMQNVMHRDLKPSNILIAGDGTLKLCDFGLSRAMDRTRGEKGLGCYSTRVITLWYRPPELLLGAKEYDQSVDIWSAGCIFGELLLGVALFPEAAEIGVLKKICTRFGATSEDKWPQSLRVHSGSSQWDKLFRKDLQRRQAMPDDNASAAEGDLLPLVRHRYTQKCGELLQHMLELEPGKRCSAEQVLESKFFQEEPLPCKNSEIKLPTNLSCHELDVKRHREKIQAQRLAQQQASSKRPPAQPGGAPEDAAGQAKRARTVLGPEDKNSRRG